MIFVHYRIQKCAIMGAMAKGNANVDYKKLWKLLIDKDMKKTDLIPVAGISSNVLAKMNKGEFVSMESIQKVCKALHCDVGDICVVNEVIGIENDRQ